MIPCSTCPRKYRPLTGDGPQPSPILIIGERPGANENKYGRVFIGKTGEELNETYLPLAGLLRSDVRITNSVLCWADGNRTPTDREIAACSRHHLPHELAATRPSLIVLMGGSACRMVPSIKLDTHHGIPQWSRLFDWEGWIVPMYHPALGLHESRWMTQLLEDWSSLNKRRVEATRERKPYKTDYKLIHGKEVADVLLPEAGVVAIDTESHAGQPFSIQFSPAPGRAYMVVSEDRDALALLGRKLRNFTAVFHNATYDLDECDALGIHFSHYRDTLQEAYHLGNLPQGLKPLVYRLFGFTMTSWEDVVRPYSIEALQCWMVEALEIAKADLSIIELSRYKKPYRGQAVKETVKKGELETLLTRLLSHTHPSSDYDPWERLDEFWRDDNDTFVSHIEARIGKYPILGIANAPLARAVEYACGDADWTGQVAVELERRRGDAFFHIDEEDRDK